MKRVLQFRGAARAEFLDAVDWYEEREPGLGRRFTAAVENALNKIAENPTSYSAVHLGVRRALVPVFPYGVFFKVDEDRILVLAVLHLAQAPWRWQRRV